MTLAAVLSASVLVLSGWLSFEPSRLDYDASTERAYLRKALPRIARDMDRCLGHPDHDGVGPTMRALLAMAEDAMAGLSSSEPTGPRAQAQPLA